MLFQTIFVTFILMQVFASHTTADKGSHDLNHKLVICADKNDVERDLIDRFMSPYFATDLQEEKCFIMCVGISLGYVRADGQIIKVEKLPTHMQPGAKKGKCLQERGRNPCDTAYLQFTCITTASYDDRGSMDYVEEAFVDY